MLATQTSFNFLSAIACDQHGNIYLTDGARVREITTDSVIHGIAGTGQYAFAGDGGPSTLAFLNNPRGLAVDSAGNVFVSDTGNNRIREILATAPSLAAAASQLTINGVSGGSPVQAGVAVNSSVQGLTFSSSFVSTNGGDWLGVPSLMGIAPGVLTVTADPGSLPPGTYQGTVTLANPNSVPNTLTITVTFNVSTPQPAKLSFQTTSLSFSFTKGGTSSSQQLTVSNLGGGTISFTAAATSTGAWLSVGPQSGTTSSPAPASLTVTATPGNLAAGTYSGSITVTDTSSSGQLTLPVTMSISAAQQTIVLSQTGLSFTAVAQGGVPLPQSFGILNVGQGSMNWTASTMTLSGGAAWLSIDQSSGTVTQQYLDISLINVSINPAGLAAGNYYGQIQVIAPGAANSPQNVSVLLSVRRQAAILDPKCVRRERSLSERPENSPGSQRAAAVSFASSPTYLSTSGWLQYLPSNATVAAGQPTEMIFQPDFTNLQAGVQHTGACGRTALPNGESVDSDHRGNLGAGELRGIVSWISRLVSSQRGGASRSLARGPGAGGTQHCWPDQPSGDDGTAVSFGVCGTRPFGNLAHRPDSSAQGLYKQTYKS